MFHYSNIILLVVDRHKLTVFYLKSFDMDSNILLKYLTTELGAANVKGKNAGESVKML